jgi:hypothetical protein
MGQGRSQGEIGRAQSPDQPPSPWGRSQDVGHAVRGQPAGEDHPGLLEEGRISTLVRVRSDDEEIARTVPWVRLRGTETVRAVAAQDCASGGCPIGVQQLERTEVPLAVHLHRVAYRCQIRSITSGTTTSSGREVSITSRSGTRL